ncbi:MAG TPA: ECF-type sigma factor [Chthoniobacteraceae bacterium]|jgi:RNA polymerase sigma factor (TIGR02999 family)
MDDITQCLSAAREGGDSHDLLPLVYGELRRLATLRMVRESQGQTLQATALVHEAWLRLVGKGDRRWENRAHFFGAASQAMRRILIENARRKACLKRGRDEERVDASFLEATPERSPDEKVLMIDEALQRLETIDPERAQVVIRKFFGGLTNAEVAASLGIGERSVDRHWACAKAWIFRYLSGAS